MDSVVSGSWWRFERYEIVEQFPPDRLPSLVIRPTQGASLEVYDVAEEFERLGHQRAPYVELARIGAQLRDWRHREPFGPWNPDGSIRQTPWEQFSDVSEMFEKKREWLREVRCKGLHEPVLAWCQRFGLLGPNSLELQDKARTSPDAGPVRSRLDDAVRMTMNPSFQREYEESFPSFASEAIQLEYALRGIELPELERRARAIEILNLTLEPIGIIAVDVDGSIGPAVRSPSLLGFMAAMALFDLGGGIRLGVCERCGQLFATRRSDKRTCSPKCREAAKKKRQRSDPDYRARELQRQRDGRARERVGEHWEPSR